ncbi:OsmC family peroxiredoxin [Rehaibacterium terrae]|uniref:Osmotically inducible protein OsmC n=1 Tax=Rehaibacterium terrae TaxID=1341696 RepID=A0A7W7Y0R9_9GAMM|nr:OsmC family peroxiredoxin [Rehaibacterium terrae]MBB5015980.1 osmotically inducible protein OsmC [Rehaibacterium terrae]
MQIQRRATARWEGGLKQGQGRLSTPQSGLLDGQRYAFGTRFTDEVGTNPEELLAAAHAGCNSMALAASLERAGHVAERVETEAEARMELGAAGPSIVGVHLKVSAKVPGIGADAFAAIAEDSKRNCVISRALGVPVSLDARLVD